MKHASSMSKYLRNFTVLFFSIFVGDWAIAEPINFSDGWKEQTFSLFFSNDFQPNDTTLEIRSDGTVSILWKSLPSSMWQTNQASWNWAVKASVPPTDLTLKGGDDRNISIYLFFLPQKSIPKKTLKLTDLLRNKDARVLMYVWGGNHNPGEILPSPYLRELGKSVILQRAGTGKANEQVNLTIDFQRAFGGEPSNLVGIAISADSDDTNSTILARISNFEIQSIP